MRFGGGREASSREIYSTVVRRDILRRIEQFLMGNDPIPPLLECIGELAAADSPEDFEITLQQIRNTVLAISAGATPMHVSADRDFEASLGLALSEIEGRLRTLLARHRLSSTRSPSKEPRRVMILLGCLPTDATHSSHLHQICSYAAAIARRPEIDAVEILVSLETLIEGPGWQFLGLAPHLCQVAGISPPTTSWIQKWELAVGQLAGAEISRKISVFGPAQTEGVYSYRATLREIMQFSPDIVIAFLGLLSTRLLPELLYPSFPQIAVKFNAQNAEPLYCDMVLSFGDSREFLNRTRPEIWHTQLAPVLPLAKHSTLERSRVRGKEELLIVSAIGRPSRGCY